MPSDKEIEAATKAYFTSDGIMWDAVHHTENGKELTYFDIDKPHIKAALEAAEKVRNDRCIEGEEQPLILRLMPKKLLIIWEVIRGRGVIFNMKITCTDNVLSIYSTHSYRVCDSTLERIDQGKSIRVDFDKGHQLTEKD